MWHSNRMCLVEKKIFCNVLCTMYGVLCVFTDASVDTTGVWLSFLIFYYCSFCSEHNKASDAETVCTDCKHWKQLLCSHSVSLPSNSVPTNFISCFIISYLSDDNKLDNKSPDSCWFCHCTIKTTTLLNWPVAMVLISPRPKRDSSSPKYSRRWHKAVATYLNTLRYRLCLEGLKVTSNSTFGTKNEHRDGNCRTG